MYNVNRLISELKKLRFDPIKIDMFIGELEYIEREYGVDFSEEEIISDVTEWVEVAHYASEYVYEPEFIDVHIGLGSRKEWTC